MVCLCLSKSTTIRNGTIQPGVNRKVIGAMIFKGKRDQGEERNTGGENPACGYVLRTGEARQFLVVPGKTAMTALLADLLRGIYDALLSKRT